MLYELKNILTQLERLDTKTKKNTYKKDEIQQEIKEINTFPNLLRDIKKYTTALEQSDIDDINMMLSMLSDLDATLDSCVNHIKQVREAIRQFFMQIPDEEIDELLNQK